MRVDALLEYRHTCLHTAYVPAYDASRRIVRGPPYVPAIGRRRRRKRRRRRIVRVPAYVPAIGECVGAMRVVRVGASGRSVPQLHTCFARVYVWCTRTRSCKIHLYVCSTRTRSSNVHVHACCARTHPCNIHVYVCCMRAHSSKIHMYVCSTRHCSEKRTHGPAARLPSHEAPCDRHICTCEVCVHVLAKYVCCKNARSPTGTCTSWRKGHIITR